MNFGSPGLLWLSLLMLPVVGLLWWSWRARQRMMSQFIGTRLLEALTIGVSKTRQKIRLTLLATAIALGLFSLSRPQWGFGLEETKQRGLDLVIAIDTSKSMLADDIQPNRLQRAKLSALDLMRLSKSDRLGLVAFAGSAFLQCPLSLDDEAFRQSVESLDVNIIPQGGTALSEAVQTALSAFKEETENHKILVLFTDGEDNEDEGSALEAARNAAKDGLRIFTIGVGTPNGELLSTADPYGNRVFIKDAAGNVVKSRLNESLLQQIAKATEGFYLPLSGAATMETLYERGLAPLPKAEFAAKTIRQYHERYQWFLGAAILLLLAEMFFPERKASTRFAAPSPRPTVAVAALLVWLAGGSAFASAEQAARDYQAGRYAEARGRYEELLRRSPRDARLQFNAGTAAFQQSDFGAASNYFSAVLTNASVALQQSGYYNLGNTQFRMGEAVEDWDARLRLWEAAAKSYRNASALRPSDQDAVFNAQVVEQRLMVLRELLRLREEDRQAKLRSEQEAARGRFASALSIMVERKQRNPGNKEFDDYIQRLSELNEIANPKQP